MEIDLKHEAISVPASQIDIGRIDEGPRVSYNNKPLVIFWIVPASKKRIPTFKATLAIRYVSYKTHYVSYKTCYVSYKIYLISAIW